MHITAPRVLGFLLFLGLIGYAFFIGPWINTTASTYSPASSVTTQKTPSAKAPKKTPSVQAPKVSKATPVKSPKVEPSGIPRPTLQQPVLPGEQLPTPLVRSWTE